MLEYLRWAANTALFVGCCFLSANIANSIFAAALTSNTVRPGAEVAEASTAAKRSMEDRDVILSRNLFNSSTLAPTIELEPVVETEELEATKLPLTLLGTAAATNDLFSWAAIKDRDDPKTKIVRVGDEIRPSAIVIRIERRRVVLDENGLPRELALEEKNVAGLSLDLRRTPSRASRRKSTSSRKRTSSSRRSSTPNKVRKVSENQLEISLDMFEATLENPADLINQARFTPKFEGGKMIGLQVNDPKPGSLFEQAGIGNGDVIAEINGVEINSAEQSRNVLSSFDGASEIEFVVIQDGKPVTKTLSFSP